MSIIKKPIYVLALVTLLAGTAQAAVATFELQQSLSSLAQPLRGADDLTPLVDAAGKARVVLLGEASHGTHEFYVWRDRLSRRLIEEHDFSFIAIEGDWSTLIPLDRYVRHHPDAPASARAALRQVERWPRWVWANTELAELGEWLRAFNTGRPASERVGIHGIDLYAIWTSLNAVQAFYQTQLPESAAEVRQSYRLLARFRGDDKGYANQVRQTGDSAKSGVARVARDLAERYRQAMPAERELIFEALQHARVVEAGERYLRLLPSPADLSWNVRADNFERTVKRLLEHYGRSSRAIVWAHNTHIGDARATDMLFTGKVSLGQLVRQQHGGAAVFAVGFGTAMGNVLGARKWEGPCETMRTPRPRPDSLEAALLASGRGDRFFIFDRRLLASQPLHRRLAHRSIGVVFDPQTEPWKNYVPTQLAQRYDAFVFLPHTHALESLHAECAPQATP